MRNAHYESTDFVGLANNPFVDKMADGQVFENESAVLIDTMLQVPTPDAIAYYACLISACLAIGWIYSKYTRA